MEFTDIVNTNQQVTNLNSLTVTTENLTTDDISIEGNLTVTGTINNISTSDITTGTYDSTVTAVSGATILPAFVRTSSFIRFGNIVSVQGFIEAIRLLGGFNQMVIRVTLPISSDFTSAEQLTASGGGFDPGSLTDTGVVTGEADTVNNEALLTISYNVTGLATTQIFYSFEYEII